MDLSITQDQLKNYGDEYADILSIHGRNEDTDRFGREWNESFIRLVQNCQWKWEIDFSLQYFSSDFDFYEKSPLNHLSRFDEFFKMMSTFESENIRRITMLVQEECDYYNGQEDEELKDVANMIPIIIGVSRSANELDLSIKKLFKRLWEFRLRGDKERKNYRHFRDYIADYKSTEALDVADVINRKMGLMDLMDEGIKKLKEELNSEYMNEFHEEAIAQ